MVETRVYNVGGQSISDFTEIAIFFILIPLLSLLKSPADENPKLNTPAEAEYPHPLSPLYVSCRVSGYATYFFPFFHLQSA